MKASFRLAIAASALAALLSAAAPALAQQRANAPVTQGNLSATPIPIVTEISIPQGGLLPYDQGNTDGKVKDLAGYIGQVYNFLLAIVGMLAAIMFIIGGFQYLTSGGDPGKITAGKKRITDALIGMVIAFSAYIILFTINPALLQLRLPAGLTSVTQQLSFLPFCDDLATQLKVDYSQIVNAGNNKTPLCGDAGFLLTKIKNQDGTTADSRNWCVFRGTKLAPGRVESSGGQIPADYGCEDNNSVAGERKIISDLDVHTLSVCLPQQGVSQADLNAEFEKSKTIVTKLAQCQSCNAIGDGTAQNLGYPIGDQACQIWQNVANNGDPKDYDFKLSKKKIVQDTRILGSDNHSDRTYYCGYSANYHTCIYVPVICHDMHSCGDYENAVMNYCEPEDAKAEIDCHANQTLGSKWGRQTGNAAHLIPVCGSDPCEVNKTGCNVGGLAGTRNTPGAGGAVGGTLRVGVRVFSAGLLGSISCGAN